jgi:hypothetical protein
MAAVGVPLSIFRVQYAGRKGTKRGPKPHA